MILPCQNWHCLFVVLHWTKDIEWQLKWQRIWFAGIILYFLDFFIMVSLFGVWCRHWASLYFLKVSARKCLSPSASIFLRINILRSVTFLNLSKFQLFISLYIRLLLSILVAECNLYLLFIKIVSGKLQKAIYCSLGKINLEYRPMSVHFANVKSWNNAPEVISKIPTMKVSRPLEVILYFVQRIPISSLIHEYEHWTVSEECIVATVN